MQLVFDGQSLNLMPVGNTYPALLMVGRVGAWAAVAISAASWTTLATTRTARLGQLGRACTPSVLVMCGGTTDLTDGDSGATVCADMESYATAARALGFDYVVACTITPSIGFTGPQETQRLAANVAIRASAGFDAVADLVADSRLATITGTYYADGIHWTAAGAAAAAETVGVAVDSLDL